MALIDKIFGRKKTLSELNRQELRKEEILLTKQRDRLFKRIEQISADKQKIFQQGATQKSPELRKALAQDFELKTQEQLMAARELNLRSKELLTVSRLRMVKENNERGRAWAGSTSPTRTWPRSASGSRTTPSARTCTWSGSTRSSTSAPSPTRTPWPRPGCRGAGQELMNIWNEMDRGTIEAGRGVRRSRQGRAPEADVGGEGTLVFPREGGYHEGLFITTKARRHEDTKNGSGEEVEDGKRIVSGRRSNTLHRNNAAEWAMYMAIAPIIITTHLLLRLIGRKPNS